ncbi:MAG: hypothetical protein ABFD49_10750 [Armatimonadota bacterium]|nr:hypothetical protein [bacterium]
MSKKYIRILHALFFALVALSPSCTSAYGIKYKTSGTFTDSTGSAHTWSINDAHTLVWDAEPYIPVGGVFESRYISRDATEENYQADIKDLEAIRAGGLTDIVLKANKPMTSADPKALQRIVDYLDEAGFTYGIEMDDGPTQALNGYPVSPNLYRLEGPSDERNIVCSWPDVDSALYIIFNKFDNTVVERGGAIVRGGKVTISLRESLRSGQILIVYPHKRFKSVAEGGMADMWSGFGEYRDRMIAFLKQVKFGRGMRFVLEPFTSKMDFTGAMTSFLPDSAGFRLGLEAYLTRKYQHEGSLNSAWGMNDNLDSIEAGARLLPLWASGRGMPYAYDRASANLYSIDVTVTQMWRDIVDYRDSSAQEFMNTISDVIRKQCVNVPVIFKGTKYHRVYANPFGKGGYDGLGAQAYGTGDRPVTSVAGPLYSLAEESAKTTWFIVAATGSSTGTCYSDEKAMSGALDYLREVGCKGFFVERLLNDTQQIDWLKGFKDKIRPAGFADFKPEVISYPTSVMTGAYAKRLMPNTWWLPTLQTGKTSYVGDGLSAYTLTGEDRTYIWSNIGDKAVTVETPTTGLPNVLFPPNANLVKRKDGTFTMTLTDVPTIIKGMDFSLVFPAETAQMEMDKLSALIIEADRAAISVTRPKGSLDRARDYVKNGQYMQAWDMARTAMLELLPQVGADVWLEGEQCRAENFDNVVPAPGASDGLVLVLDTNEDPPLTPYSASFTVDAQGNSSYEMWIAGTPPSDGSPMSYTVDDINWTPLAAVDGSVESYGPGLSWYKIGAINLFPGKHILRLRADGRRSVDNRYYFAVDAVVLSPRGFKPNGVIKPY